MFVCLLIKKPFSFFFFHMNFEQNMNKNTHKHTHKHTKSLNFEQNMNKNIQKTQKINKFCTFFSKIIEKKMLSHENRTWDC